jgi:hypothetical protein
MRVSAQISWLALLFLSGAACWAGTDPKVSIRTRTMKLAEFSQDPVGRGLMASFPFNDRSDSQCGEDFYPSDKNEVWIIISSYVLNVAPQSFEQLDLSSGQTLAMLTDSELVKSDPKANFYDFRKSVAGIEVTLSLQARDLTPSELRPDEFEGVEVRSNHFSHIFKNSVQLCTYSATQASQTLVSCTQYLEMKNCSISGLKGWVVRKQVLSRIRSEIEDAAKNLNRAGGRL